MACFDTNNTTTLKWVGFEQIKNNASVLSFCLGNNTHTGIGTVQFCNISSVYHVYNIRMITRLKCSSLINIPNYQIT